MASTTSTQSLSHLLVNWKKRESRNTDAPTSVPFGWWKYLSTSIASFCVSVRRLSGDDKVYLLYGEMVALAALAQRKVDTGAETVCIVVATISKHQQCKYLEMWVIMNSGFKQRWSQTNLLKSAERLRPTFTSFFSHIFFLLFLPLDLSSWCGMRMEKSAIIIISIYSKWVWILWHACWPRCARTLLSTA